VEVNPPFSSDFFFNELEMTRTFYVEKLMERERSSAEASSPSFVVSPKNCRNIHMFYVIAIIHGQEYTYTK